MTWHEFGIGVAGVMGILVVMTAAYFLGRLFAGWLFGTFCAIIVGLVIIVLIIFS